MIETLAHVVMWLFFGLCSRFMRTPEPVTNDTMARWRKLSPGMPIDEVSNLLGPSAEQVVTESGPRWNYEHCASVTFNFDGTLERWAEPSRWVEPTRPVPSATLCAIVGLMILSALRGASAADRWTVHVPRVEGLPTSRTTRATSIEVLCMAPDEAETVRWRIDGGTQGQFRKEGVGWVATVEPLREGDNVITLEAANSRSQTWSTRILVTRNSSHFHLADFHCQSSAVYTGEMKVSFEGLLGVAEPAHVDWSRASLDEVTSEGRRLKRLGGVEIVAGKQGEVRVRAEVTISSSQPGIRYFRLTVPGAPELLSDLSSVTVVPSPPLDDPKTTLGALQRVFYDAFRGGQSWRAAMRATLQAAKSNPDVTAVEMQFNYDGLTITLRNGQTYQFFPPHPGMR